MPRWLPDGGRETGGRATGRDHARHASRADRVPAAGVIVPLVLATTTLLTACDGREPVTGEPTQAGSATPSDLAAGPSSTVEESSSSGAVPAAALGPFEVTGSVPAVVGDELSGVAAGRAVDGLWLVDDEPGTDEVHVVGLDGELVASVTLRGAATVNPEDLAVGPCPDEPRTSCVHLADIGDNVAARADVVVWSFPEEVAAGGDVAVDPGVRRLVYEDGPVDAEALVVTADGAVVVVDKAEDVAGVHVAAAGEQRLRRVGGITLPTPSTPLFELVAGRVVTAADLLPDGSALLLRTYDEVLELATPDGGALDPTAIEGADLRQLRSPGDVQGEGIAYLDGGAAVVAVAEGSAAIRVAPRTTGGS